MEQEIKKLTKAVDKLARELKRYNDTKNAGPAGVPGKYMDPTQLPDVKVSLGQRNEERTFKDMIARAMSQEDQKMQNSLNKNKAAERLAELDKIFGSDF